MASRLFGYNSGAPVSGATQSGNLAVSNDFKAGGAVQWWNGPNEDLGYVIGSLLYYLPLMYCKTTMRVNQDSDYN